LRPKPLILTNTVREFPWAGLPTRRCVDFEGWLGWHGDCFGLPDRLLGDTDLVVYHIGSEIRATVRARDPLKVALQRHLDASVVFFSDLRSLMTAARRASAATSISGNLKRIQTVFAQMVLTLSSSGLPPLWRPSGKVSGKWRRQLQKSDVAA
jgi:hypothetical protein